MAVADRLRREGMLVAVVVAGSVASLTLAGLQRSFPNVLAAGSAALTVGVLTGVLGAIVVDTGLGLEGGLDSKRLPRPVRRRGSGSQVGRS